MLIGPTPPGSTGRSVPGSAERRDPVPGHRCVHRRGTARRSPPNRTPGPGPGRARRSAPGARGRDSRLSRVAAKTGGVERVDQHAVAAVADELGGPTPLVATTGTPARHASRMTIPNGSSRLGITNSVAPAMASATCSRDSRPTKWTRVGDAELGGAVGGVRRAPRPAPPMTRSAVRRPVDGGVGRQQQIEALLLHHPTEGQHVGAVGPPTRDGERRWPHPGRPGRRTSSRSTPLGITCPRPGSSPKRSSASARVKAEQPVTAAAPAKAGRSEARRDPGDCRRCRCRPSASPPAG